ncbi:MAG: phenylalanine--tRNA ligase subunit alpha [Candidatus Omnitrophica bacterium]|nr:phenylalanine--tRNA ligase subunit alpha [Candidatus Omnitrophota bacterium]
MNNEIFEKAEKEIEIAQHGIKNISDNEKLEQWRIKYFGRKGLILSFTQKIGGLPEELRPLAGRKINEWKNYLNSLYENKKKEIISSSAIKETFHHGSMPLYTYPGKEPDYAYLHPLTIVTKNMVDIFKKMGFGIHTGPEIETDYYNFSALNTPENHPARDMWDTLYLDYHEKILLRTHTSPVQIRIMKKIKPPFRIIAVGKCFRRDAFDSSHSPVFHQMEGLMVGHGINFAHLKGILIYFLKELFDSEIKVRFLPAYFPFTEPSAEISISCVICKGKGCSTCGGSGWLEILGAGMVHPEVFGNISRKDPAYSPDKITGFAFGMGIERIAMLKYGIDDIRHFYNNDIRFISQFG